MNSSMFFRIQNFILICLLGDFGCSEYIRYIFFYEYRLCLYFNLIIWSFQKRSGFFKILRKILIVNFLKNCDWFIFSIKLLIFKKIKKRLNIIFRYFFNLIKLNWFLFWNWNFNLIWFRANSENKQNISKINKNYNVII